MKLNTRARISGKIISERLRKCSLGKRGLVYTLSLTMLMLLLLSLAVLFLNHSNEMGSRQMELSFAQKIYDLDTSIQGVLGEAYLQNSAVIINYTQSSLTVAENLPRSTAQLDAKLTSLKQAVEESFTICEVNLSEFLSNHYLVLQPKNISYNYSTNNTILMDSLGSQETISGYNISLLFAENVTSCVLDVENGGGLTLSFKAEPATVPCNLEDLNVEEASLVLQLNGKTVSIEISESGLLEIVSEANVNTIVKASFPEINNSQYLELPIDLNIEDPAFDFSKKSRLKVWLLSSN